MKIYTDVEQASYIEGLLSTKATKLLNRYEREVQNLPEGDSKWAETYEEYLVASKALSDIQNSKLI
tara:strand:- start:107 stop:304 length:198 start_codon:yes stop_codon:yes gene_type:complete